MTSKFFKSSEIRSYQASIRAYLFRGYSKIRYPLEMAGADEPVFQAPRAAAK